MKKIIIILLISSLIFSFAGCSSSSLDEEYTETMELLAALSRVSESFAEQDEFSSNSDSEIFSAIISTREAEWKPSDAELNNPNPPNPLGNGILVAYYTTYDNFDFGEDTTGWHCEVRHFANFVADALGTDIHPIIVAEKYPADDDQEFSRRRRQEVFAGELPKLDRVVANELDYEYIVLVQDAGMPRVSPATRSFFESLDMRGRTIIAVNYRVNYRVFGDDGEVLDILSKRYPNVPINIFNIAPIMGKDQRDMYEERLLEFFDSVF